MSLQPLHFSLSITTNATGMVWLRVAWSRCEARSARPRGLKKSKSRKSAPSRRQAWTSIIWSAGTLRHVGLHPEAAAAGAGRTTRDAASDAASDAARHGRVLDISDAVLLPVCRRQFGGCRAGTTHGRAGLLL
eukprot:scaffold7762_cov107-Isochrysis_galbana.AAC.2